MRGVFIELTIYI